jgi:gas vesicle protein
MPNSIRDNMEIVKDIRGGTVSNLAFLLAGCGIGATLALLFAPKAGRELRGDISEITRVGYDETLELAHELKDRSTELYQSLRESADRVYDVAATKLHLTQKAIDDSVGTEPGRINGEIGRKSGTSQGQTEAPPNTF